MKDKQEELTDDQKIERQFFMMALSNVTLAEANQIIQKVVAEEVRKQVLSMSDEEKKQVLDEILEQESKIIKLPEKKIIV